MNLEARLLTDSPYGEGYVIDLIDRAVALADAHFTVLDVGPVSERDSRALRDNLRSANLTVSVWQARGMHHAFASAIRDLIARHYEARP